MSGGGSKRAERRGGRQKGTKNKATLRREEQFAASGMLPIDFLLAVMRDPVQPMRVRIDAAVKVANYIHPRLASIESKIAVEKRDATDWTRDELVAFLNEGRSRRAASGNGTAAPTPYD